jgi:hypothetical protein
MDERSPLSRSERIQPRLLDVAAAGRYCGISKWSIRGLVERGILVPVSLPGINGPTASAKMRRVLFDRSDLDRFIDAHKAGSIE